MLVKAREPGDRKAEDITKNDGWVVTRCGQVNGWREAHEG